MKRKGTRADRPPPGAAPPVAGRGPSDKDIMREQAAIRTALELAFPGAVVEVVGIAAPNNTGLLWRLRVGKAGVLFEAFKKPDTPVKNAILHFRKAFAEGAALAPEPPPEDPTLPRLTTRKRGRA